MVKGVGLMLGGWGGVWNNVGYGLRDSGNCVLRDSGNYGLRLGLIPDRHYAREDFLAEPQELFGVARDPLALNARSRPTIQPKCNLEPHVPSKRKELGDTTSREGVRKARWWRCGGDTFVHAHVVEETVGISAADTQERWS